MPTPSAVLDGARQILMEKFAEDAELLGASPARIPQEHGHVRSTVVEGKETEGAKFRDWFDFAEPIASMPSHRALALLRGRNEGMLQVALVLDSELDEENIKPGPNPCEQRIAARFGIKAQGRPADKWLADTVRWTWKVKVYTHLELELMNELRERAEEEAIRVFGRNLKDLLLAAPAGQHVTMGVDPGIRTGCKIADRRRHRQDARPPPPSTRTNRAATGMARSPPSPAWPPSTASQPGRHRQRHGQPRNRQAGAGRHEALPGSAADQDRRFGSRRLGLFGLRIRRQGIPDLDVSIRGAVSIARRLQDPLAELVKIDPKSIGVGQYQHDVSQTKLARNLDAVVEDCVNAVGVDVNTASIPLLTRISGLNAGLAANIVSYRDANGAFKSRNAAEESPAPRRQDLRTGRRLPARAERRQPARQLVGAPGSLPGRRKDHCRPEKVDQGNPRRQPRPQGPQP